MKRTVDCNHSTLIIDVYNDGITCKSSQLISLKVTICLEDRRESWEASSEPTVGVSF